MNSFRLAVRVLRVDPRTRLSAVLMGTGVAVATALVLLLVSLPYATESRGARSAWQEPSYRSGEGGKAGTATIALAASDDFTRGEEISRVDVAAVADPDSIRLPEGVPTFPGPGETLVSPALGRLLDRLPTSQLGDRYGEVVGTLGEDALEYPGQLVAVVGHEAGGMPPAAVWQQGFTVGGAEEDTLLAFLAGVGVVVLLVPSLVLVASAARLTAARREQRLAALRLAGATPRQVVGMVAAETTLAAAAGALLGLAISPVLHAAAAHVPWNGGTWQPDDFVLSPAIAAPIVVAVPLLVLLAAVLGLRRVVWTPLGAVAAHSRKPLHWWRLLALPAAGLCFFGAIELTASGAGGLPLVLGGLALVILSAVLVGPWVTSAIGGIFLRAWRRPSALLAGRRLRDDPRGSYRASSGVVLAVLTGSMALTLLPTFESMAGSASPLRDSVLYVETDTATATGLVERTDQALARYGQETRATGIGQVVLSTRSGGTELALVAGCERAASLLQADPGGACAGTPGVYNGYPLEVEDLTVSGSWADTAQGAAFAPGTPMRPVQATGEVTIPPVVDRAVLPPGIEPDTSLVAVPTTPGNAEVVRTALAGAANGMPIQSRETRLADQDDQLADLRRVTVIGLVAAALLGGCSAAIATAGSVLDRRRTFGALLAAGTPVRVLARALRTEAAMPALVATVGAGLVGTLVGAGLFSLLERGSVVLTPWILAPVALGALVAVLAAAVCRPALARIRAEPLSDE